MNHVGPFFWVRRPPSFQKLPSHLTSPGAHPRQEFNYVPLEMRVAFQDCSWQEKDLRKWPLHSTFWWNKGTGSIWLVLGFDHWFLIGQSGHFSCQSLGAKAKDVVDHNPWWSHLVRLTPRCIHQTKTTRIAFTRVKTWRIAFSIQYRCRSCVFVGAGGGEQRGDAWY